jgi:hypothetical protein
VGGKKKGDINVELNLHILSQTYHSQVNMEVLSGILVYQYIGHSKRKSMLIHSHHISS